MVDNQLLLVNSKSKVFDKNLFVGLNWVKNKLWKKMRGCLND